MYYLAVSIFAVVFLLWLRSQSSKKEEREARAEKLRILREFTEHSSRITSWLREHKKELETRPMAALKHPELLALVNEDQKLYERLLEVDPEYPDTVMPPKELHRYFIEVAQGYHRQTH